MKKNLRIVSAAAAALLAVAPVAASAVNVNADGSTVQTGGNTNVNIENVDLNTNDGQGLTDLQKRDLKAFIPTATVQTSKPDLDKWGTSFDASKTLFTYAANNEGAKGFSGIKFAPQVNVFESATNEVSDPAAAVEGKTPIRNGETLKAGHTYIVRLSATINTAKNGEQYKINGKNMAEASSESSTLSNVPVYAVLHVIDSNIQGNPYVAYRTTVNGVEAYQTLANNQVAFEKSAPSTVSEMVSEINGNHNFKTFANSTTNGQAYTATENDVKDQLKKANIDVKEDGTITSIPKSGFYYTITAKNAENGHTATARVFFKGSDVSAKGFPLIKYEDAPVKQGTFDFHGAMPIVNLKLGTNDWADYILNKFKAYQSGKTNVAGVATGNAIGSELRLVSSDLTASGFDANHTGLYKMTLVAKNSDQKETTLDFNVAVTGSKIDEISNVTVHADKPVSLVSMVGDTTSDLHGVTVNPGQQIQVYANDTKTVDGVEYTRVAKTNVDREHNNEWIESSYLHAAEKTSVKIMHSAKVYNKDHNATGAENKHAYNMVEVVADESGQPKKFTIGKDVPAYKLADGSGYIDSRNVTATPKKLNHNSYVYNSNGKAKTYKKTVKKGKKHVKVTRRVLKKKGTTVKTYGAAFNIKGHKMFRIGVNQYIKVANFE